MAHALLTDPYLVGHLAPRELQVFELLARTYRSLGRPTFNAYETLQHAIQDGHVDRPGRPARPPGSQASGGG